MLVEVSGITIRIPEKKKLEEDENIGSDNAGNNNLSLEVFKQCDLQVLRILDAQWDLKDCHKQ